MAEGFLREFFSRKELAIEVNSGGVASNARDGMLISVDAKDAMQEIGIKLSDTSKSVELKTKRHRELIKNADLILALTKRHKEEIMKFEEANNKIILTIKEFAGENGDIEDPSMKGIAGFRVARDAIIECLNRGLEKYDLKID